MRGFRVEDINNNIGEIINVIFKIRMFVMKREINKENKLRVGNWYKKIFEMYKIEKKIFCVLLGL